MFGGAFNRLPFDRPYSVELYFALTFDIVTEVGSHMSLEFPISVAYEFTTEAAAEMVRDIPFGATYEFTTEFDAPMTRELMIAAVYDLLTEFEAGVRYTHTDAVTFSGGFAPGDKIVIDCARKTVTINGDNALYLTDGDFLALINGTNLVTYTDGEGVRSVRARITHRDKYLY
ncbi:phage distal tail protein [Paenibacillus durus]|uniref:phage distal tail protein n=1 Tax=Paenibacillus durus TaxID=44251 RepID=UPI000693D969|nr:phage tail domain-containing protein [Paenibacillus durus]